MDREPIESFVSRLGITIVSKRRVVNPKTDWERSAHHWSITLSCGGKSLMTPWSAGMLVPEAPTAVDVLTSLQLDVSGYKNAGSLHDFMQEYGYEDKREGERLYEACRKEVEGLTLFLGQELVDHLLENVDGL